MKQKLLIVLAFVLICTISKVQAYSFSAVAPTGQTLYYNIKTSNTVEVTSEIVSYPYYNIKPAGILSIPDSVTYNGSTYFITSIGNYAFYQCSGLTSISTGNSVDSIGNRAFSQCSNSTNITIGSSVTTIGVYAFEMCSKIFSLIIPNSVISIGNYSFSSCNGLMSISIGNSVTSIGNYAFSGCNKITSISITNSVKSIGNNTFTNCSSLTSVTLPNSVTSIGYNAFEKCTSLTSITIPDSVKLIQNYTFTGCTSLISVSIGNSVSGIGYNAFLNCTSLTSLILPNSLRILGSYAFSHCSSLKSISLPDSITLIADNAFLDCNSLDSVIIPSSVTSIRSSTFGRCTSLTSVTIPTSVITIEGGAFSQCTSLTSITIPTSVTTIGGGAFSQCTNLNSITIPTSVTSIGSSAFKDCTNLISISLPNSITSIQDNLFSGCTSLNSITIPNSVVSIKYLAFNGCTSLNSVTIPNSVRSILSNAFSQCTSLTSIIIPDSLIYIADKVFEFCTNLISISISNSVSLIGSSAFAGCSNLVSINVDSNNAKYSSIDGVLFNKSADTLLSYPGGKQGHYIIPNSVNSIGYYSFSRCMGLTSIFIPNNVSNVEDGAFYCCTGLDSIIIGNSVISVGNSAFFGCVALKKLLIPNSVDTIGGSAFSGCTLLNSIICLSTNPPYILTSTTFDGVNKSIPLYVPCSSKSLYLIDYGWKNFTNYFGVKTLQIISDTICQGSAFTNYGQNISTAGVYDFVNNCDSIRLNLAVKPNYQTTFFDTICKGKLYNNYGFNFIADTIGIYTQNLQKTNSCDSIIILNITFFNTNIDTITAKICQGQVYNKNGFNADSTGIYTQNLHTINGCDSIITLNLTVNPVDSATYYDTICQGQTYNNYGFYFNADTSGIYIKILQTINSCDSIITLNLTVNPIPITPNLSIEKKSNYLEITWDSVGESYDLYRNNSLIATISQAIYIDTNVVNDSSYCYKIKAFLGDCESDYSDTECLQFAGLEDMNIDNMDINLYPNPTNGKAKLSIQSLKNKANIIVHDLIGRIVKTYIIDTTQKELEIDLTGFAKGVYNISIKNNNTNISKKLVIQ